jgi:hypothetical protein
MRCDGKRVSMSGAAAPVSCPAVFGGMNSHALRPTFHIKSERGVLSDMLGVAGRLSQE